MRKLLTILSFFLYACPGYVPYPDAGQGSSSSSEQSSSSLGESSSSQSSSSMSSSSESSSSSETSSSSSVESSSSSEVSSSSSSSEASSASSSSQSVTSVMCGEHIIQLPEPIQNQPAVVRVAGNRITKNGNVFGGRGVNIHDQRSCAACAFEDPGVALAEAQRRLEFAAGAGATFVRLLLESYTPNLAPSWAGLEADPIYREGVRELLEHAAELDLVVLFSVWDAPSLRPQGWPSPDGDAQLCAMVAISHDLPNVIIGVSNEPENNFGGEDNIAAHASMARAAGVVRAAEIASGSVEHVVAVQGLAQWGRTLNYYVDRPVPDANGQIAYETHPYNPREDFLDVVFEPASILPVIVGEAGNDTLGYQSLEDALYLAEQSHIRGIPFAAWTLHHRCPPNLLVDHSNWGCGVGMPLELTEWGQAYFSTF